MGDQQKRKKKPLQERIKDRIRDLADEVVGALEGLLNPEPEPIPVRVRRR
jgi:hypothetical protein